MASFTTIVSDQLIKTVNFYEDHFGFIPAVEQDGYVLLERKDPEPSFLAVIDVNHKCLERRIESVKGVILSLVVQNVSDAYDSLYHEGLTMYKDLSQDIFGDHNFVVEDPNGVLVDVREPLTIPRAVAA